MCLYINIVLPEKSQKYKFVWRRRDTQETSRLGSLLGVSSIFKQTYLSNLNIGLINLFLKFNLCFVGGGGSLWR